MITLTQARSLANAITEAQTQFETYISPLLQDYLAFLPERGSSWATYYKHAPYFTFKERDGQSFIFEGDEYNAYGNPARDYVSLPFDFVANPELYKATILAQIKSAEEKKQARIKATAEEKVTKLKAQLAKAEEDLAKATQNNDPISTIASRNQAQKLRDDLAQSATPEQG